MSSKKSYLDIILSRLLTHSLIKQNKIEAFFWSLVIKSVKWSIFWELIPPSRKMWLCFGWFVSFSKIHFKSQMSYKVIHFFLAEMCKLDDLHFVKLSTCLLLLQKSYNIIPKRHILTLKELQLQTRIFEIMDSKN